VIDDIGREFKYTGSSFEETVGEAEPFHDAIGRISLNFSELDAECASAITFLLKTSVDRGHLVTSEMSFKAKLGVLSSLVRLEYQVENQGFPIPLKTFEDLLYMCQKSEELRNKLMHSSWVHDHANQQVRRRKLSAKMKRGFQNDEEALTPGQILDIADYISVTTEYFERFFHTTYPEYSSTLPKIIST